VFFESGRLLKKTWDEISSRTCLLASVIQVFDAMGEAGELAGGEDWLIYRQHFIDYLLPRILERWCENSGKVAYQFPWNGDHVTRTWIDWRKALDPVKDRVRQDLGLPAKAPLRPNAKEEGEGLFSQARTDCAEIGR
jgi:hypothetical protein